MTLSFFMWHSVRCWLGKILSSHVIPLDSQVVVWSCNPQDGAWWWRTATRYSFAHVNLGFNRFFPSWFIFLESHLILSTVLSLGDFALWPSGNQQWQWEKKNHWGRWFSHWNGNVHECPDFRSYKHYQPPIFFHQFPSHVGVPGSS